VDYATVMEQASEILRIVREKQGIFDGVLNPEDIEKHIKAASDFGEICSQVEKLQDALREYQDIAIYITYRLASMIKEHLEMTCHKDIELLNKKLSGLSRPTRKIYPKSRSRLRVV